MENTFYAGGLRFSCVRCSNCCRHTPGYVFLIGEDIQRLLLATGLDLKNFQERYCREVNLSGFNRVSLKEKTNYDCIFWEKDGCSVYRFRPMQCRSYPFWSGNLVSARAWEQLKSSCPGIGQGRLHSRREIDRWLRKAEVNRFVGSFSEME
ncbi:MAG: YkgJ family cysteine cluster protein [Spirochaetaceae bacterium]|nr:MAG: YkgJ family cysteine cluster protein [Spirochaetaceae bacterium]